MSTAHSGLNEFPVLLRLPDLNAVWVPLPSTTTSAAASAAPATTPGNASVASASVASAAVTVPPASPPPSSAAPTTTPPATAPVIVDGPKLKTTIASPPETSSPAPMLTTAVASATSTAAATPSASNPSTSSSTTSAAVSGPTLLSRVETIAKTVATIASQRPVIRQLATGGALVGGLALTYFLIMGGGSDVTPDHISNAETTLEPPVIETGSSLATGPNAGPVVVRPEVPAGNTIADVPPPPDFGRDWQTAPVKPTHIEVAETITHDDPMASTPPEFSRPQATLEPRDESYRYEGRIGPESSALHAPTYPTTDPATFEFRPVTNPREYSRVNTAKLEGTIAPPPLR